MPDTYFVDAWFLIALTDRTDSHHMQAKRLARALAGATLVTHDAIFFEVLAYFSTEGAAAREHAVANVRDAMHSMRVIPSDRALFVRSLDRYAARPDKEYSLTDCMSMVLMEEHDIRRVLTNDHHFTRAGFTIVTQ